MRPYIVRQGDHLAGLAARFGFDGEEVWNDEQNRDLAGRRHPQVLCPGDVLYMPDTQPGELSLRPRTLNRFRADTPQLRVSLQLRCGSETLANERYTAHTGASEPQEGASDGEGRIHIDAPAHLREVRVSLPDRGVTTTLRLGEVDPAETPNGVAARLSNLGYLFRDGASLGAVPRPGSPREREARLASALSSFQRAMGLDPTGQLDADTASKLEEAHGS